MMQGYYRLPVGPAGALEVVVNPLGLAARMQASPFFWGQHAHSSWPARVHYTSVLCRQGAVR